MNRKIIIILNGLLFNRKLEFPIEELIPDLPEYIQANDPELERFITKIVTEGILHKSNSQSLTWIAPSQIKQVQLKFDLPTLTVTA